MTYTKEQISAYENYIKVLEYRKEDLYCQYLESLAKVEDCDEQLESAKKHLEGMKE